MKFILSLTHQCNLGCRYCYAGSSRKQDMTLDMAKHGIDTALTWLPAESQLDLGLFGGEPLLRFDLIKEIVSYTRQQADKTSTPVQIFITTNGTLISPEILDYFSDQSIRLCFSLDGRQETHDRNRCYKNGRGSFTEVVRHLKMAIDRLCMVEVNAVVGPDSLIDVPQSLDFFLSMGVPVVHFNPNIMAKWPSNICNRFDEIYRQVAEGYVACYRRGAEIALNLIDSKAILFLKGGYAQRDKCSMGDGEWGIAPSGNIYPCERLICEDDDPTFCLGNIKSGLNHDRRCALRSKRGNNRSECRTCFYNRFCMSWCGCTNWFMSGAIDMPSPVLCAMEKAAIEAGRYAFETLVKDDNDLFADHLLKYVNNDNRCRLANATTSPLPKSEVI